MWKKFLAAAICVFAFAVTVPAFPDGISGSTSLTGVAICFYNAACTISGVWNTLINSNNTSVALTGNAVQLNITPSAAASAQFIGGGHTVDYGGSNTSTQQIYGEWGTAIVAGAGFPNAANGIYGEAAYLGSASDGGSFSLYGGHFQSQVDTSGATVTHVIGIKVDGTKVVTGATVTAAYGIYVQNMLTNVTGTVTNGSPAYFTEGIGDLSTGNNCTIFSGNNDSGDRARICSTASNVLAIDASVNLNLNTQNHAPTVIGGVATMHGYTVATLPASPGAGSIAYVTDATSCATRLGTLTGGGSTFCPVVNTGAGWVAQ